MKDQKWRSVQAEIGNPRGPAKQSCSSELGLADLIPVKKAHVSSLTPALMAKNQVITCKSGRVFVILFLLRKVRICANLSRISLRILPFDLSHGESMKDNIEIVL